MTLEQHCRGLTLYRTDDSKKPPFPKLMQREKGKVGGCRIRGSGSRGSWNGEGCLARGLRAGSIGARSCPHQLVTQLLCARALSNI